MTIDDSVFAISKKLKCLVCQGQSIDASETTMAKEVKTYIRLQLEQGRTENQILETMTEKYGTGILVETPFESASLTLWFLPLLILTLTVCGVALKYLARNKHKKDQI